MKLNYDIIRDLLLKIEEITDGNKNFSPIYFFKEFSETEETVIAYHLKYLFDAGLVEGSEGYVIDITPFGRNYLDSIRNHTIWEETKSKIQPLGSVTLSVVSEIAKSLILSKLGL